MTWEYHQDEGDDGNKFVLDVLDGWGHPEKFRRERHPTAEHAHARAKFLVEQEGERVETYYELGYSTRKQ